MLILQGVYGVVLTLLIDSDSFGRVDNCRLDGVNSSSHRASKACRILGLVESCPDRYCECRSRSLRKRLTLRSKASGGHSLLYRQIISADY